MLSANMDDRTSQGASLRQIVYLSSASREWSENELMDLLKGSRFRNQKRGVTGLMLYCEGNIAHVIEGKDAVVRALFKKISKDPRHRGIQLLWSKEIEQRDFPDYTMGFRRAAPEDLEATVPTTGTILGGEFFSPERLASLSKQVAILLKTFARNTRMIDGGFS